MAFDASQLEPLFEKAERLDLWFVCRSQDVWFSPAELKKQIASGHFRWGAPNWVLLDPHVRLAELRAKRQQLSEEIEAFRQRMRSA